jgi:hypothetical protein
MLKSLALLGFGILLSASMFSCSKLGNTSSACNNAGYYAEQSECQNSISSGSCSAATVLNEGENLVCWKSTTTSNQTGNTSTGTGTNTSTSCNGQSPPWTMGAWAPATCGVGVTQRTRTVTCDYSCPCVLPQPSTTETCAPNMFLGRHYESECPAAGGTLLWIDGNRVCSMSGFSCKSGWSQYYYNSATPYTITTAASAQEHTNCVGGRTTVTTGYHSSFTPARAVETRSYCSSRNCFGCKTWTTLKANISSVACF